MAPATSSRDVRVIHWRIGVPSGEHRMGISVAIQARCARRSCLTQLRMKTVSVCVRRFDVAAFTRDLLGSCFVHKAFHVLVTVDARQFHRPVYGVLKLLAIYKERDRLPIDIFGQRRIAMTGEAILIFQLVLGANGEGRAQQKENRRTEQNPAGNFHAYEETPAAVISP